LAALRLDDPTPRYTPYRVIYKAAAEGLHRMGGFRPDTPRDLQLRAATQTEILQRRYISWPSLRSPTRRL
jgi:hypothetical protein